MYSLMKSNVLIIFIKYPQVGFVKTRLAKDIGKRKAASLYRLSVEAVIKRTESRVFQRIIFYTPREKEEEVRSWLGGFNLEMYPQEGNNLGQKLMRAFDFVFKKGAVKTIIIGSDSPEIENKIIISAFKNLKNKHCVIGPSLDGGYYLLGLSRFYKEIFQRIDWGTGRVFKQTLKALNRLQLKVSCLGKLSDIDTLEDLVVLSRKLNSVSQKESKELIPIRALANKIVQ